MLKIKKDSKLSVDKLVMSVMENSYSFSTATEMHGNHSEAIDFTIDKSFLNEAEEKRKEKNTILFFKINFIEQVESGIPSINDAFNNNIDKSLVSRWIQNKKKLLMALRLNTKNSLRKTENGANMKGNLRNKLNQKFIEARSEGLKVPFSWLYTKSNALSKALTQNLKRLSKTVVVMFLRKYNLKLRRVQRKKTIRKKQVHSRIDEIALHPARLVNNNSKIGRFPPSKRVNLDQAPLPFSIYRTTTHEEDSPKEMPEYYKVWVANPGAGWTNDSDHNR